jgi:sucrose-phosphate synthase
MAINDDELSASTIAAIAAAGRMCLVSDIDGTLVLEDSTEQPGLAELAAFLSEHRSHFLFAVATGRNLTQTIEIFAACGLPRPDVIIASVGAEIFHGESAIADAEWSEHIGAGWNARQLVALEKTVPGLWLQEQDRQGPHKVSFYVDPETFREERLVAVLKEAKLDVTAVYSRGRFLDILPPAASKGKALHYLCSKYSITIDRTIAFGDSGNDRVTVHTHPIAAGGADEGGTATA